MPTGLQNNEASSCMAQLVSSEEYNLYLFRKPRFISDFPLLYSAKLLSRCLALGVSFGLNACIELSDGKFVRFDSISIKLFKTIDVNNVIYCGGKIRVI